MFVVPSVESRMWMEHVYRLWDRDEATTEGLAGDSGRFGGQQPAPKKSKANRASQKAVRPQMTLDDLLNGVMPAGETPTQHYLKEQLVAELGEEGLLVRKIEKVEFSMKTEFPQPAKWMGEERVGRPWDWMAVAEKIGPV